MYNFKQTAKKKRNYMENGERDEDLNCVYICEEL